MFPTEKAIQEVMKNYGMDYMQARNHLTQKYILQKGFQPATSDMIKKRLTKSSRSDTIDTL